MAGNDSYGASWADQWDYSNPDPVYENKKNKKNTATLGGGKKVGDSLEKTKGAAITGAKKVKEGAALGFQWVKDKYNKRTQKQ
ncbi:hypothetical protein MKW98_005845 [Papaver atlanticum]|uniref:CDP-diacylglycerol-glycerol-3-phosphate 3-phosphatidyltransferase n=1 Tax=Papaver atlanticum TaxID=357466 RepID=A0AAD4XUM6_9MAGN|nr:hypothetical protein MKW98_005845 [Papaver atlanticum]